MKKTCSYCDKYKAVFAPRNGCITCWEKYFTQHPNEREAMRLLKKKFGSEALVKLQGAKYAEQYENYERKHTENANAAVGA